MQPTRKFSSTAGWRTIKSKIAISSDASTVDAEKLKEFLLSKNRITCVTGAGISTRSGIPDYRGPNGSYSKGHRPMMHKDFVTKEWARKRYWSRSIIGFRDMFKAQPNDAHLAITQLQQRGIVNTIITQNVDGLHQRGGSQNVIDLHGRLDTVSCLSCGNKQSRSLFQDELERLNREYLILSRDRLRVDPGMEARPDGDIDLGEMDVSHFAVPGCSCCGGVLKPDVVFFGDSVPASSKDRAMNEVESSDGILVVGSSLEVFSAFRLIRRAIDLHRPIALVNLGETRLHRFVKEMEQVNNGSQLAAATTTPTTLPLETALPPAAIPPMLLIDAECAGILQRVLS